MWDFFSKNVCGTECSLHRSPLLAVSLFEDTITTRKIRITWGYYKVLKSNKVLNKNSHYFLRPECAERT